MYLNDVAVYKRKIDARRAVLDEARRKSDYCEHALYWAPKGLPSVCCIYPTIAKDYPPVCQYRLRCIIKTLRRIS